MIHYLHKYLLLLLLSFLIKAASAQYKVQGTVYENTRTFTLEAVTVESTGGRMTTTNENGFYSIDVSEKDSIWFSYLGKPTIKFPVSRILNHAQFDIALQVPVPELKEIIVRPKTYREDSIQNRKDYEKIFNFRKPNLETMTSIGPQGAGIDINELIRTFQFRKNKSTLRFQERLLKEERDKFIAYRFNKPLIRRLTNIDPGEIEKFIEMYSPPYEFALFASDYDFQEYIKESYEEFVKKKGF